MAVTKEEIIEALKEMPALELADLVHELEDVFGVSAAAPVAVAAGPAAAEAAKEKLEILGGISDGKAVSAAEVQAIADLPSHDQLLGMLLNVMLAPMSGMARVTAGPISGFLTATKAIADQKEAA